MPQKLEHYWMDLPGRGQLRGLVMVFRDGDMLHPGDTSRNGKVFTPNYSDLLA